MRGSQKAIKGKIDGNLSPRRLLDETEARLWQIAERNPRSRNGRHRGRGGHGKSQEAFVIDPRKTQTEAAEVNCHEDRAAHFRIQRLPKTDRQRNTKDQRNK